jgi:signal peptidase I
VVIFKYPRDSTTNYVKRVVGLPGDRVQLRQGQLYINGQLCPRQQEDDYVADDGGIHSALRRYVETLPNSERRDTIKATGEGEMNNTPEYLVPPGHVFVLGDNCDNSLDSRFMNGVGFVPLNNVFVKAGTIYWSHQLARIGPAR